MYGKSCPFSYKQESDKMTTLINDIEDYINLEKSIISRIGKEESQKIINGIKELLQLKELIDNKSDEYFFTIKQEAVLDFAHISVYLSHISLNGVGESILKTILDYDTKYLNLYWIDSIIDGFILRYEIKRSD